MALDHVAVENLTFASEELAVNGLARQRMPERQPLGRLLHDQVHVDQLVQMAEEIRFVELDERLQQREIELTADDGRQTRHPLRGRADARQPAHNGVVHTARDAQRVDGALVQRDLRPGSIGLGQYGQNLLREERIAIGQPEDRVHKVGRQ